MSQNSTYFTAARDAFDLWSVGLAKDRMEALKEFKNVIPSEFQSAFNYQYEYAKVIVEKNEFLVSPTGESNELYTQGRGVSVMLVEEEGESSLQAVFAFIAAMLVAGNSIVICSDNNKLTTIVDNLIKVNILPDGVIATASKNAYSELIELDVRNFVYVGNSQSVVTLNKALSLKPNAITALVSETDMEVLPNAKDPMLVLQFVTERVRTTNITAIGGNAMLLELGGDSL